MHPATQCIYGAKTLFLVIRLKNACILGIQFPLKFPQSSASVFVFVFLRIITSLEVVGRGRTETKNEAD